MMKMLVACSGGPDSVALVHALKNTALESQYFFVIGHVNHQLRGRSSDLDAEFVKRLAASVHWPCVIVKKPVKGQRGNLEENAREARYEALESIARKHKCRVVLTAHTLDDQAETIFMNILRGSGPDGLAGIWPLRMKNKGTIWISRPFLAVTKAEVLRYLERNGYTFRKDQSNANFGFLRNWIRLKIFPQLEQRVPGFQKRLGRLGELMREEQQFWSEELMLMRSKVIRSFSQGSCLDFKSLLSYSAAAQRRFLRSELGGNLLTFEAVEKLRQWMNRPPSGGRFWQLKQGWVVERLSRSQGAPSASFFLLRKAPKESKYKK